MSLIVQKLALDINLLSILPNLILLRSYESLLFILRLNFLHSTNRTICQSNFYAMRMMRTASQDVLNNASRQRA